MITKFNTVLLFLCFISSLIIGCSTNNDTNDSTDDSTDDTVMTDDMTDDGTDDTTDDGQGTGDDDFIKINVVHHISRDDNGNNPSTTPANVALMMSFLNANYMEWEIEFITKEITFVDNTQWNIQFVKQDDFIDQRVLLPFEDETSLNIFYFNEIGNRENGVITGTLGATALFPDQGNNLKLSASAFETNNTATLTHETGHYFGLYHTSDDNADANGNLELVDGSNCKDAGDFICDTAASPDLNDSNINEPTCDYVGTETDSNGDLYTPDTLNYMTQWAGTDTQGNLCRSRFSQGQVQKIISVINNERSYLIE